MRSSGKWEPAIGSGSLLSRYCATALLAVAVFTSPASAQQPAPAAAPRESAPRWSLEAFGGAGGLDPADLNAFARNREVSYSSSYVALFDYYRSVYGQAFSSNRSNEGSFPVIGRSWTGGVRLSRRVAPRVTATLGVRYLSEERSSTPSGTAQYTIVNPNSVAFATVEGLSYDFAPIALSVRAYTASAGLRVALWNFRRLKLEALVQGGPVRASARIREERTSETIRYRTRSSVSMQMRGTGWGPSAEGGLRAAWSVTRRWALFAEGIYEYQRAGSVSGTMDRATTTRDGDATSAERVAATSTSGRWRMAPWQSSAAFGGLSQPYPVVGNDQYEAFKLDLSGVRVNVGLAWRW